MDNPQQQNLGATLGEISTIRNILMGNHMAEYTEKFQEITETFNANERDKDERFKAMEADMTKRFELMQKEMNERFDKLEALLTENVQRINEKINTVSTTDKADLGRLLAEVSNRLING